MPDNLYLHASLANSEALGFLETISAVDVQLLKKMNGEWHNSFWDDVFPLLRESKFWIPAYFFLLLFAVTNYRKHGWYWCLAFILTVVFSDFLSSRIIKENFFRLRPCRDLTIAEHLRFLVKYCPQSSSFTSSHAVTHFAMAAYINSTFKSVTGRWTPLIFLWPVSICYAQVYVGVHYPSDIVCGAIVGIIIGYLTSSIFNKYIGLQDLNNQK
jgi:membrane-associated phospholipid phosphatase